MTEEPFFVEINYHIYSESAVVKFPLENKNVVLLATNLRQCFGLQE